MIERKTGLPHEYRHLLDYITFLQTEFNGDAEKMKHSRLYKIL